MSTEIQTASDLKYIRRAKEDRRERESIVEEVLVDEEQHADVVSQKAEPNSEKKLPAVRRRCFRVFTVSLVVLYLLILAGIITRYVLVTNKLQSNYHNLNNRYDLNNRYNNLFNNYTDLFSNYTVHVLQNKGKLCPEGWMRFGCSCYFKSTENKTWSESRRECEDRGSDLVIISSKEEHDFVTNLTDSEESWIGLRTEQSNTQYNTWQWKWVEGSSLTEKFWATGDPDPTQGSYAACCQHGRWTPTYYSYKNWICERKIFSFSC